MKSQIKKRIAAALLLAASFLGHNYKTGAVDHVDSRKFKNNKQSASFPLWAKIVISVGSLALLIGISKLRCRPRANISKDDIDKNVDNFINKCENKCKIKEQNKFRQKNCKAGRKKEGYLTF